MKKTILACILSGLTVTAYAQSHNDVQHNARYNHYEGVNHTINEGQNNHQRYNLYNANSHEKNHQLNLNVGSAPYVENRNLEISQEEMRKINGFVIDSRGHAVRSSDGRCVITGFYDPATAYHPECTPKTVEQVAVVAVPTPVPVSEPTPQPVVVVPQPNSLRIHFEFDSSRLTSEAQNQITNFLRNSVNQNNQLQIIAGADFMGTNRYNKRLSMKRTQAIKQFVESQGFNNVADIKAVGERHAKQQHNCERNNREQLIECIADDRFGIIRIMTE